MGKTYKHSKQSKKKKKHSSRYAHPTSYHHYRTDDIMIGINTLAHYEKKPADFIGINSIMYQPSRLAVGDRLGPTTGKLYKDHKRRKFDELLGKPYGHLNYNSYEPYLSTIMPDARPGHDASPVFDLTSTTTKPPTTTTWTPQSAYNAMYGQSKMGDDPNTWTPQHAYNTRSKAQQSTIHDDPKL